jgi:hypothetical protein
MARCPFADWRRLPGSEPSIVPRTVIFHTMVGYLTSTDTYFRSGNSGGIESHFGVGGKWGSDAGHDLDGAIWQWRDTEEQADANLHANGFAVSIETADNAPGSAADLAPWTPAQLASLVRLGIWLKDTHNIPARICQSSTDSGFGWHAMWGAPSDWTPAVGKVCPGAERIHQLKTTVFPAIFAGTALEEDMPLTETDLNNIALKVIDGVRYIDHGDPEVRGASNNLAVVRADLAAIKGVVGALSDDESKVLAAITAGRTESLAGLARLVTAVAAVDAGFTPEQATDAAATIATALKGSGLPEAVVAALKTAL